MYTVTSVLTKLTDPEVVLKNVSETLRKIDPNFTQEEKEYQTAVNALKEAIGDTVSPSALEYIAAKERQICAELVYVAWLGFQQNLKCFQDPINTMFLKQDILEIASDTPLINTSAVASFQSSIAIEAKIETKSSNSFSSSYAEIALAVDSKALALASNTCCFVLSGSFLYHAITECDNPKAFLPRTEQRYHSAAS